MSTGKLMQAEAAVGASTARNTLAGESVLLTLVMKPVRAVKELQRKLSTGTRLQKKNKDRLFSELELNKLLEIVLTSCEEGIKIRPDEFRYSPWEGIKDIRSNARFNSNTNDFKNWGLILNDLIIPLDKKQKMRLNEIIYQVQKREDEKYAKELKNLAEIANEEFKKDMLSGNNSIRRRQNERMNVSMADDVPF